MRPTILPVFSPAAETPSLMGENMRGILARWLILTLSILAASYLVEGIVVRDFFSALLAAAVLGILNAFFRPVLLILTLPINILSMGLFTFVINAFLLKLASGVISGFEVQGFWSAVFGSLIISLVNWFLSSVLSERRSKKGGDFIDLEKKDRDHWG